jgi:hypothetical protein
LWVSRPAGAALRLVKLDIILSTLLGDAEGVVGFADCDEASRCFWVVAVVVGVVLLGKGVELALYFGRTCRSREFECLIVVG